MLFFVLKNQCFYVIFSQGCYEKDRFVQSHLILYYNKLNYIGTMVVMKLENQTTREIKEVFDMFAPVDEGFVRTRIPIAEVCPYAEPIARSQARRILYRLEEFKQIELIPIHANATVLGMVRHVKR